MRDISLYIHIPYCVRKCPYCDFYSIPVGRDIPSWKEYLNAIFEQLEEYISKFELKDRTVKNIYFGGGTPSIFPSEFFLKCLSGISKVMQLSSDIETTCEVNPATVDREWFVAIRNAGVNRISVGVQSFQSHILKFLGRVHDDKDAMRVITDAKEVGFESVGIDVIFGIPNEKIIDVKNDIKTAMMFQPEHVSAYQLTVERGTPLAADITSGKTVMPSDEEVGEEMKSVFDMLLSEGWNSYEISNFAKSGFECRHNINYWRYGEYVGLGPSAVSFLKFRCADIYGERIKTEGDIGQYIVGEVTTSSELIDLKTAMFEFCFLGLRMDEGFSIYDFFNNFGEAFNAIYGDVCSELVDGDMIVKEDERVKLTPKGRMLSNSVFSMFAPD